jgi:hypothetical protein
MILGQSLLGEKFVWVVGGWWVVVGVEGKFIVIFGPKPGLGFGFGLGLGPS